MARDYFINGETLVQVKGRVGSAIASLSELGLSDNQITISPIFHYKPIHVEAWGEGQPEVQWMLAEVNISMSLVHYDADVLEACVGLSMGGVTTFGTMGRAGTRMAGPTGVRFTSSYNLVGVNLTSPVASRPWRFLNCYLSQPPYQIGLGAERSLVSLNWKCIAASDDPYNGGNGAQGYVLFDRQLDS